MRAEAPDRSNAQGRASRLANRDEEKADPSPASANGAAGFGSDLRTPVESIGLPKPEMTGERPGHRLANREIGVPGD